MIRLQPYVQVFVMALAVTTNSTPAAESSACPFGTRDAGSDCVLDSDVVLSETLEVGSFTTVTD